MSRPAKPDDFTDYDIKTKMQKKEWTWNYHPDEKVHVGIFCQSKPSKKLACFDFDSTLSLTKNGSPFPKDASDCKLLDESIPSIIKSYYDSGYRFVVFTNQLGVTTKHTTIDDVKSRISIILEAIGVPGIVLLSIYKNAFRKPRNGMMNLFLTQYNTEEISLNDSFYVGDSAGRGKTSTRPKDHSDADYLFALNTGLPFILPEQFLAKEEISKAFKKNLKDIPVTKFNPKSLTKNSELLASELLSGTTISTYKDLVAKIKEDKKNQKTLLIILVGLPGSGKSTLAKKLLPDASSISRDALGTMAKCEKELKRLIDQQCETIYVDNTNTKEEERQKWIQIAANKSVSLVAIHVDASVDQCLHNNSFRRLRLLQLDPQMDESKVQTVPTFVINKMAKTLTVPSAKEGFKAVYKVKCCPKFSDKNEEKLYFQYLN